MSTNKQVIEKAAFAVADLASGGKLNPEQANAFIRKLILQPTILRRARTVVMNSPVRNINKIGFGTRVLRPGVEGTALSESDKAKPTTEQVVLTTKKVKAEVNLTYDAVEDNIERGNLNLRGAGAPPAPVMGGLKDTIVTLLAERAALDLEELGILGDTASGDAYLALTDGYLKLAATNTYDHLSAGIDKSVFKQGQQTMPKQYLRNKGAVVHMISDNNEIEYRDTLSNRETATGDSMISGTSPVFGFGSPVVPVNLMPEASGLYTDPLNLIFGIQRDISIEVDKDIQAEMFIIVLTARVDFKIEETAAVVRYDNIV